MVVLMLLNNKNSDLPNNCQWELACIEVMVPKDHLLRVIDKHIDFSFIYEKAKPYYNETTGRPAIDPVRLFKMMLIGYLYGIRSVRQLEQEVITNVAYRWFLGLGLMDTVPDHTTISWNRINRFKGTTLFEDIFQEVVELAINYRMVGGRVLITDSTHIQANASKNRYEMKMITETPHEYLQELEDAVNEDRVHRGKEPLPTNLDKPIEKKSKVSLTDPESGYFMRKRKPEGFAYIDHRTVDHKMNIITDTFITSGNVNDATVYVERLEHQMKTFKKLNSLEAVALDTGYMTPYICKKVTEMSVFGVIAERGQITHEGAIPKQNFQYNREKDCYICPDGKILNYVTTSRSGNREYKSDPEQCKNCSMLEKCTQTANHQRTITRHVWQDYTDKVISNRRSTIGNDIYQWRSQTVERSFADAKELHGLRQTRFRGRENVQVQAYMTAIAQNIKKIARHLEKVS